MERLRLSLGTVQKGDDDFKIVPGLAGGIMGIKTHPPSLDEAMTALAQHLGGACSLDSRDWN